MMARWRRPPRRTQQADMELLNQPAVQGGVAPLAIALVIAALLARTRFAWLAIVGGYATMIALTTGFQLSPLTASRKILLLGLIVPVLGVAADLIPRPSRAIAAVFALAAGLASIWALASVLRQQQGSAPYVAAAGIAVFGFVLTALVLALRDDGLRTGAAGLGLGLATGVAAVLSASIGFLLAGIAVAAAAGALLLVQVIFSRNIAARFTGALSIAILTGLFAAGSLMLAQLPWYALPLLLLVPLAAMLPASKRLPLIARAALLAFCSLVAAIFPIAAAWYAARGSFS
jgi:hypothetical protein